MSLTKHPRRWCWRWRVSCTLEQNERNLNILWMWAIIRNHGKNENTTQDIWVDMPEGTRDFLWYDNLALFGSTWNEEWTRLRPCQGVISEICPASTCHCRSWFSQPWGKTVRSFWWTAGVLSSLPVWDVSPQGIRWFIRTFRLLAVGWGPGGPRRHEYNGMPSPPFSSCLKRKPICGHPCMIRLGDKSSDDTSWASTGIWCLYLTKDENNWWTHIWIKNCNSLDNIGRAKRVRTTRWSLLRIALAFLSLATTSFGRWVIAACFKCEVNLEQGIVRISWGRRKNRKVSDGIESFHTHLDLLTRLKLKQATFFEASANLPSRFLEIAWPQLHDNPIEILWGDLSTYVWKVAPLCLSHWGFACHAIHNPDEESEVAMLKTLGLGLLAWLGGTIRSNPCLPSKYYLGER